MLWAALMEPAIWADDEKPKPVEHAPDWPWLGRWFTMFTNRGGDSELILENSRAIMSYLVHKLACDIFGFWNSEGLGHFAGVLSFRSRFWELSVPGGKSKAGDLLRFAAQRGMWFPHPKHPNAPEAHSIHAPGSN